MALEFKFTTKTIIEEGRTNQPSIDSISQWLKETSLPQLQEEFIVLFLLSCSNNIDATKKTIQTYFKVKNGAPEIFDGWNVKSKEMENIFRVITCSITPARMDNNIAVSCIKCKDTNYRNFDFVAAVKMSCMMFHLVQMHNPPNKTVIVFDLKGIGFMHLTCVKMKAAITYLEYIQEAIPIKISKIHILNSNYVFDRLLWLLRSFMNSELISSVGTKCTECFIFETAIETHSQRMNMKEFHEKWVPSFCLPKEFGGELPSLDDLAEDTMKKLREMQGFFEAEEQLRRVFQIR